MPAAGYAYAVLKNPPILVLDEATLAVDSETEAAIWRSLEPITVDRLIIVEQFLLIYCKFLIVKVILDILNSAKQLIFHLIQRVLPNKFHYFL
ncbi:hypothetical protein PQG02_01470 [Nostoc sp. UHCC 0926]|nr:hypothetical protein [Nostoc sp. UHCC 0926]WDD35921.1 hypothetical protein PQG02_01470 [Nostoc sp. UHCC 0926]